MSLHTYRMATNRSNNNTKCWWGFGATGILIHCWWKGKMVQPYWKKIWQFFTQLNILLPYNPAIILHGIYPKEVKTYIQIKPAPTCLQLLIHKCQNLQSTNLSFSRWTTNCSTIREWNILQCYKEMSYQTMKRHGGNICHITKWKKPVWKSCTLYACPSFYCMCPSIWHSGGKFFKRWEYLPGSSPGGSREFEAGTASARIRIQ